jgi:hypothetical protein
MGEVIYTEPSDEWEMKVKDDRRARLQQVAPEMGDTLLYEYDFGDSWKHQITVECFRQLDWLPSSLAMAFKGADHHDPYGIQKLSHPRSREHWWGAG